MKTIFSLLICGTEQIRRRCYKKGIVLLALYVLGAGYMFLSFYTGAYNDDLLITALIFVLVSFVWLYNLLDICDYYKDAASGKSEEKEKLCDGLYEKGRVLYFKGELEKAKECFDELLKVNREDMDTVYQLAKINSEQGNIKEARIYFQKYLKKGDKPEWLEEAKEKLARK